MDLVISEELRDFREAARTWLEENVPDEPRPTAIENVREYDSEWQRRQFEGGWAGVAWPAAHGGRELSPVEQIVWYEECLRAGAPTQSCFIIALGHAGPTIITHGSEEQKQRYLPGILKGDTPWCQGFSEPNAGSDLGSLETKAEVDGNELVVTGQKIWTSFAQICDLQELMVRTDPGAPKHKGLSWVVCDMSSPGIEIRPIRTIDGDSDFCEVFYDEVRIPLENVVGGLNNGWQVAMSTLGFERGIGYLQKRLGRLRDVDQLIEEARRRGLLDSERLSAELAMARAEAIAVRAAAYETISGESPPALFSAVHQLLYGQLTQRISRLILDVLGSDGLVESEDTMYWLLSFPSTIAGGSKDIQKNILGERHLGIPR